MKKLLKKIFNRKKEDDNEYLELQEHYLGYLTSIELDSIERQIQQNDIDYALNTISQETYEANNSHLLHKIQCIKERYLNQLSLIHE